MDHGFSEGDLAFRFTSNRLCLDFLATRGEVGHRDIERIGQPSALSRWIVASGILDEAPLIAPSEITEAVRFRELLRGFFRDVVTGSPPSGEAIAAVNEASRRPLPRMALGPTGDSVSKRADAAAHAALSSVARDALALISEGLAHRVKQCADPTCNMFFLDASRGNNRVWCSTEGRGCGNKAKKRAFRERQRERA